VGGRHSDVGHHQVGHCVADQPEQPRAVSCLPDDLEAGAFEQAGQTLAEQNIVVGQDHP
jgi:hypothetical protein